MTDLPVSQAAREAAATWCEAQPFPSKQAEASAIRDGSYDHHSLAQAFARFEHCLREREPAPSSQRELLRGVADAADDMIRALNDTTTPCTPERYNGAGQRLQEARDRIDTYLASTTQEPAPSSERERQAFYAGWKANGDAHDYEGFAPYPPTKCGEAYELYACSLTDRNLASTTQEPAPARPSNLRTRGLIS
jgi:hypothetical protein